MSLYRERGEGLIMGQSSYAHLYNKLKEYKKENMELKGIIKELQEQLQPRVINEKDKERILKEFYEED